MKLCLLTRHGHDELHAEMREGSQKCQRSRSEEMVLKFVDEFFHFFSGVQGDYENLCVILYLTLKMLQPCQGIVFSF